MFLIMEENRLPDTYYTEQTLNGIEPKTGIKRQSPTFNQGEDVLISFYLNYQGAPVVTDDWRLDVVVKKSPAAKNVLWHGIMNFGLYKTESPGFYKMVIPAPITSLFLPGTYYMDVKGIQKFNKGHEARDLTRYLLSTTFNLRLTAASPNPTLRPMSAIEFVVDPETGDTTIKITTVEPTLPESTDISVL